MVKKDTLRQQKSISARVLVAKIAETNKMVIPNSTNPFYFNKIMALSFTFSYCHGSYDNIHDLEAVKSATWITIIPVPNIVNPTYRDMLAPTSSCFLGYWRLFYAGNFLQWDDPIPPTMDGKTIQLISWIGHWSSIDYARNFPVFALPHIDWIKKK